MGKSYPLSISNRDIAIIIDLKRKAIGDIRNAMLRVIDLYQEVLDPKLSTSLVMDLLVAIIRDHTRSLSLIVGEDGVPDMTETEAMLLVRRLLLQTEQITEAELRRMVGVAKLDERRLLK